MTDSLYKQKKRRLADWDYSSNGFYFVTFCTSRRKPYLGSLVASESDHGISARFCPSRIGEICKEAIEAANERFAGVSIDSFVIMPNHVHLLIRIDRDGECKAAGRHAKVVPQIVAGVKSAVTHRSRMESLEFLIWQQRYHDHVVRNEADLNRIREYIEQNPLKWALDKFYVE